MRFQGNILENLANAQKSNDDYLGRELVIDELATIIEQKPQYLIDALKASNVDVDNSESKEELINLAVENIYNNNLFQKNIAVLIANKDADIMPIQSDYASQDGQAAGAGRVNVGADPVSAIAGAIGSIFNFASASKNKKAEEERSKAMMYSKIFGEKKKRNWVPVAVIGGILIIGGIVAYATLRKK